MRTSILAGVGVMLCSFTVAAAQAPVSVTLRQGESGYTGAGDTKIVSSSSTTNYGSAADIEVDGSPDDRAGLLRWDLTSIPAGSFVTEVGLSLQVFDGTSDPYEIHALKRNWTELGATWSNFAAGMPWSAAGALDTADAGSQSLGTVSGSSGSRTFALNADGVAVVQSWIDGNTPNNGFIIRNYDGASNGIDFYTREHTTISERPAITVTYYSAGAAIPPSASFVANPPGGKIPVTVAFDASESDDIDGSISTYSWSFGDGASDTGMLVSHEYSTAGEFEVELIVTDDEALSDTTKRTVRVTPFGASMFAVLGDFGDDGPELADVASEVNSWSPDFIITVGDNNYPDGEASTMDANVGKYFGDYIFPYYGSYGSTATSNLFFPTLGNHDWHTISCSGGTCSGAHFDYFTLPPYPAAERYYEFVWGDVHFFALDSDSDEPDGTTSTSVQAQWLQSRMAESLAPWKIVYLHHAPYSSGKHRSNARTQWPYAEWGADAVLAGHDHTYERVHADGIVYFVNGLGGRSTYEFTAPIPGSEVRYNSDYGAMRVTADSVQITFEFVTRTGTVVDSYTLTNDLHVGAKVFLEGPYDTAGDSLATELSAHVPLEQPFDSSLYAATDLAYDGSESFGSLPPSSVDWILLSLMDGSAASPPMKVMATRAGMLRSDGAVLDTSGSEIVTFRSVPDGHYRVAARHRNHLAAMSMDSLSFSADDTAFVDLTGPGAAYGDEPQREVEPGTSALFTGDADLDGEAGIGDFGLWLVSAKAASTGYLTQDFNLDGSVDIEDFALWLVNAKRAVSSEVP